MINLILKNQSGIIGITALVAKFSLLLALFGSISLIFAVMPYARLDSSIFQAMPILANWLMMFNEFVPAKELFGLLFYTIIIIGGLMLWRVWSWFIDITSKFIQ